MIGHWCGWLLFVWLGVSCSILLSNNAVMIQWGPEGVTQSTLNIHYSVSWRLSGAVGLTCCRNRGIRSGDGVDFVMGTRLSGVVGVSRNLLSL